MLLKRIKLRHDLSVKINTFVLTHDSKYILFHTLDDASLLVRVSALIEYFS